MNRFKVEHHVANDRKLSSGQEARASLSTPPSHCAARVLLIAAVALIAGCQSPTLNTRYSAYQGDSINGVRVFVDLLRERHDNVTVFTLLSPQLKESYDAFVVFQSSFGPPSPESKALIEELLQSDHTVLFVLRDFDASISFWEHVLNSSEIQKDPERAARVRRAYENAETEFTDDTERAVPLDNQDSWYGLDETIRPKSRAAQQIDDPFQILRDADLDPSKLDLRFRRRLLIPEDAEAIWTAGDEVLLADAGVYPGKLYILANASFLLNGALVNPEHRKLAGAVATLLGRASNVAVVISDRFADSDATPGIWRAITTPPMPWILGHLVAILAIFCWYRLPIFGRPAEFESTETRRFGRHVEALGDLLAANGKQSVADERIRQHSAAPKR